MGGVFTMDAVQAARAAAFLAVPTVLPIHYATFPMLAQDTHAFAESLAQYAPNCRMLDITAQNSVELD
jgi:L-ascorbate metabolism protein UlaG (beta-lactamase superfamily)